MVAVEGQEEWIIAGEDDVFGARRRAHDLALAQGFDPFAAAAVTTATSELARNIVVHAGNGTVRMERISDGSRSGVRLRFIDRGPGIIDLEQALAGGNSTAGSLGLGLSGSVRLVDEFDIQTEPGRGTEVTVVKWRRRF
jgi:serine/threonine-protein kinase RsbT